MNAETSNLRYKLEGGELDLSMMRYINLPVLEIATLEKATKIDLSNNEIETIPSSFALCCTHITKLDFGSNKLRELPTNFGNLVNLKHLDLYNNQLRILPLSLSNLQNLRYLDVKDNPLRPEFAAITGGCLSNKDCQFAARNLISFLTRLKTEQERRRNLEELKEKERAMARGRQEEEERARKKADKKAAKEKKRQHEVHHETGKKAPQAAGVNGAVIQNGKPAKGAPEKKNNVPHKKDVKNVRKASGKWSRLGMVNLFLLLAVTAAAGTCVVLYAEGDLSVEGLKQAWPRAKRNSVFLLNMTLDALSFDSMKQTAGDIWKTVGPWALRVQGTLVLSYNTTKNLAVNALHAVGVGDLSPYVDGLRHLWRSLVSQLAWLGGVAWEWLATVDWEAILARGKTVVEFLLDQFRVVNAELWRNEAVTSAWESAKPLREGLWSATESLSSQALQLYSHFEAHWWPLITEQTYYIYATGRRSIESFFQ